VPFIPHDEILSLEEFERLVRIFSMPGHHQGARDRRRTFLPAGLHVSFLSRLRLIEGVRSHVTTNGVKTANGTG
jgi:hypothetical protein